MLLHEGCSNGSIWSNWSNWNGNFQFDSGLFKWSPTVLTCLAWGLFKWFNLIKLKWQFSIWLGSFQMDSGLFKWSPTVINALAWGGCSNSSIWSNWKGNFQFDSGFFKWSPTVLMCLAWGLFKWFNLIKLKKQFSIWLGLFQMVSHSVNVSCMRAVQMVQFDQIERAFFNLTPVFSNGLPQW